MAEKLRGKAWVFEGLLDVDWGLCPFETVRQLRERGIPDDYEHLAPYAMSGVDPDFAKKARKGDFVVAGESMGYGHDHDHPCKALKGAGVGAILCESTNANFLRNCIDHGLPIVECPGIMKMVKQGDELELDLQGGKVSNLSSGASIAFTPFPEFIMRIIDAGGLYPLLEHKFKAGQIENYLS